MFCSLNMSHQGAQRGWSDAIMAEIPCLASAADSPHISITPHSGNSLNSKARASSSTQPTTLVDVNKSGNELAKRRLDIKLAKHQFKQQRIEISSEECHHCALIEHNKQMA